MGFQATTVSIWELKRPNCCNFTEMWRNVFTLFLCIGFHWFNQLSTELNWIILYYLLLWIQKCKFISAERIKTVISHCKKKIIMLSYCCGQERAYGTVLVVAVVKKPLVEHALIFYHYVMFEVFSIVHYAEQPLQHSSLHNQPLGLWTSPQHRASLLYPSEVYDHAGVIRSHDVITAQTPEGYIYTNDHRQLMIRDGLECSQLLLYFKSKLIHKLSK